ncbi:MAG: hypothetical protein ACOX2U_02260 [Limisphaerales bacterium]|mgnify:CR=1 FL=1|jgi:hypothetical protein|nr:hypothetical protein [Verrucomicrobiota bacterium]
MSDSVGEKGLEVSAFSAPRMGKLRKYFVVACLGFCALAFMLTSAAIAAEDVEGVSSVKDEALETFIKFSNALPERFDLGFTITYHIQPGEDQTNYCRVKKDGESALFYGKSMVDPSVLTRESIGDLNSYRSIHSKFDNIHWRLIEEYLTTWTNRNIPSEKDNELAVYFGKTNGAAEIRNPFLLSLVLSGEYFSWKDIIHFSVKLDGGEDYVLLPQKHVPRKEKEGAGEKI